jgi:hypothetical protein
MLRTVNIFVSYSHEDSRWVKEDSPHRLIPWLKRALNSEGVDIWWDKQLVNDWGERYRPKIEEEIDRADIALLLLSQNFVISSFIRDVEIPRIRARVENGQMLLAPILVGPLAEGSSDAIEWIEARQIIPVEKRPLITFVHDDAQWEQVRTNVLEALQKRIAMVRRKDVDSKVEQSLEGRHYKPEIPAETGGSAKLHTRPPAWKRFALPALFAILAAFGIGALTFYSRCSPPAEPLAIVEPHTGVGVERSVVIRGTFSPPVSTVVVVVHPIGTDGYWVQRAVMPTGPHSWQAEATIGSPTSEDHGRKFEIVAFGNPRISLTEGRELQSWPAAEQHSNLVEVQR